MCRRGAAFLFALAAAAATSSGAPLSPAAAAAAAAAAALAGPVAFSLQVDPQKEVCLYEDVKAGWEIDASALVYRGGQREWVARRCFAPAPRRVAAPRPPGARVARAPPPSPTAASFRPLARARPPVDIKLRVEKPDGAVLYEQLLFSNLDASGALMDTIVKKGAKVVAPAAGAYAFCLDNRMARWTAKVQTFELELRDPAAAGAGDVAALAPGASASETAAHSVAVLKRMATRLHSRLLMIENAQLYHYHREITHRAVIERTRARVGWFGAVEGVVVLALTLTQVVLLRTWVTRKLAATGGAAGLPRASASV